MAEFRKALALAPQNAAARNNSASLLAQQGNITDAIEQLQETIALQTDFAEAHYNLGLLLLEQGNHKAGETELQRALELGYSTPAQKQK